MNLPNYLQTFREKEFTKNLHEDKKEFDEIKFDNKYSKKSRSYKYIERLFEKDFETDELNYAREVLKDWNLATDSENRSAPIGVCVLSSEWISEQGQRIPQDPEISFRECVSELIETYGRVDPLWSERNFIVRGNRKTIYNQHCLSRS